MRGTVRKYGPINGIRLTDQEKSENPFVYGQAKVPEARTHMIELGLSWPGLTCTQRPVTDLENESMEC